MLEAICRVRKQLGVCVLCYVPAHVGCSPNEYADMAAKAATRMEEVEDAAYWIGREVRAKPVMLERVMSEERALADRPAYAEYRRRVGEYVRGRIGGQTEEGRITAAATGVLWEAMGRGAITMTATAVDGDGVAVKPTWEGVEEHNEVVAVTMAMRTGGHMWERHGAEWRRRRGGDGSEWARDGEWGCWACRDAANARRARQRGEDEPMEAEAEWDAVRQVVGAQLAPWGERMEREATRATANRGGTQADGTRDGAADEGGARARGEGSAVDASARSKQGMDASRAAQLARGVGGRSDDAATARADASNGDGGAAHPANGTGARWRRRWRAHGENPKWKQTRTNFGNGARTLVAAVTGQGARDRHVGAGGGDE